MEGVLYKGKEMKAQIAHCQVIEGELALDTMNGFFERFEPVSTFTSLDTLTR